MAAAAPSSLFSLKPRFGAGGVEEVEVVVVKEGGGVCYWLYERRGAHRKRESKRRGGQRNSVLFKWESKAHRGKGTESEKQKKVESGLIYARKKLRHSLRKTRAIELKKHWIFFFNVCFCTLMTQRGFRLNSPDREELMVSCWGSRAEGRNLNALGWTMPALWIITLAITLNQGEWCLKTLSLTWLRHEKLKVSDKYPIFHPFIVPTVCAGVCELCGSLSVCAGSACIFWIYVWRWVRAHGSLCACCYRFVPPWTSSSAPQPAEAEGKESWGFRGLCPVGEN